MTFSSGAILRVNAAAAARALVSIALPLPLVGRSRMCPTLDLTMYSLPKYLLIVFALAGDSTITKDLDIGYKFSLFIAIAATRTAHIYKDKLEMGQVFS